MSKIWTCSLLDLYPSFVIAGSEAFCPELHRKTNCNKVKHVPNWMAFWASFVHSSRAREIFKWTKQRPPSWQRKQKSIIQSILHFTMFCLFIFEWSITWLCSSRKKSQWLCMFLFLWVFIHVWQSKALFRKREREWTRVHGQGFLSWRSSCQPPDTDQIFK